jgi:hypothetical protein
MPSFEQFDNLETGLSVRTKINLVIAEVSDNSTEWSAAYSWTQNAELSSLNDVITAGALDDEVLAYSSVTGNWIPKSLGAITNPLAVSDLTDTVISALADKDVLQWNGTNWLNAPLSIKDLSDVSDSLVTTPGINTTWRILSYVVGVGWTATVPDLDALESVSNTAPSSVGQVLRWSGSFWTPSLLGVDDLSGVSDAPPSAAGQVLRWNGSLWTPSLLDVGDLESINLSGLSTNDVLQWNGSSWVPVAMSGGGGASALNDLTDVNAPSPALNQVLTWNGSEWAPAAGGGGGATELADLTDVDASVGSPSDGNILVYRSAGNDWVLEAKPAAGSNPAAADITDATADGIALITSADANPFTDADELKLDGIEASADVTDAANVAAAGAAMASNNLSDLANAATARTNLGVDAAGTDNSTDVTLAGTPNYLTIAGQVITRGLVDLSTDVTGSLPEGSVTGLTASLAAKAAVASPVFDGPVATIDDSDTPRFATVWDVPALADVEISRWQGNSLDSNSALQSGAKMAFYAEENWDATSNATRIEWWATNSAGSFAKRMEMSSGGDLDVAGYVKADEIILGTKNYGTATPATTGYSEGSIFFVHA